MTSRAKSNDQDYQKLGSVNNGAMFIPSRLHYWLVKAPFSWQLQKERDSLSECENVKLSSPTLSRRHGGVGAKWGSPISKSNLPFQLGYPLSCKEAMAQHCLLVDGMGKGADTFLQL